jgi:hypothetical protein
MKTKLLLCLAALTLMASNALYAADENDEKSESAELGAVITMCEEQYTPETYPDDEERNRLIEQCINDNSPQSAN